MMGMVLLLKQKFRFARAEMSPVPRGTTGTKLP